MAFNTNSVAATARNHIEVIRKLKFSIGGKEPNPLTQDLHHAVTNLSAELYTKDVHFLMELIQNAEDNEYLPGVEPTLEFVLTSKDITGSGAPATLLVFNNEVGFSKKNMDSVCSVGRSTKKGKRHRGFIGEKGIGFKSVFLVSTWPHIFSNGYQVRFSEIPNQDCGIGYIVPEWIDSRPCVSDLQSIYGSDKVLPTTTIILPLKLEKAEAVKKQLWEVHPEVLLFLCRIKRLMIRENNGNSCAVDSVSAVSISNETNQIAIADQRADSRVVHLSVQEDADVITEGMCRYYIWRQVFPVKPVNKVGSRMDIEELVVSLAFPFGERLKRGASSAGIFSFLPTSVVTNFPFIIQADFILASSRESIVLDNKWNEGILECIPSAFVNALVSCMESTKTSLIFSVAGVLNFLPVQASSFLELNIVRESIRTMIQAEHIVPYESFLKDEKVFCKPTEARRILPEFRQLLFRMMEQGITLNSVSSLGNFVLHSSVDLEEYNEVLDFLGVLPVHHGYYAWYGKCIEAYNIISRASMDVHMDLFSFLAYNWKKFPFKTVKNIQLLEYVASHGEVAMCSVTQIRQERLKVHFVQEPEKHAWLNKWNLELECPDGMFFLVDCVVTALIGHKKYRRLRHWLESKVGVLTTTVNLYCLKLTDYVEEKQDPKLIVSLAHLLYHAKLNNFIAERDVYEICRHMPVVDRAGQVHMGRTRILMPASGSRWAELFGSDNPFTGEFRDENAGSGGIEGFVRYVELGEVYAEAANLAGEHTPKMELLNFLAEYRGAVDLPDLQPPDVGLQAASSQMTSDQAILLLDWIRNRNADEYNLPVKFIESIRDGKWMKTYSGFRSPSQCFLYDESEKSICSEMGSIVKVSSVIDEGYYEYKIRSYRDELMFIGVRMGFEDMHLLINDFFKQDASYTMSRYWAISLLQFLRVLRVNGKLNKNLLKTLKEGKWLKTNLGYTTPVGSVFLKSEGEAVSQITGLPIVDETYYGGELSSYFREFKLLGVVGDLGGVFKLLPRNFTFPKDLSTLTRDSTLLLLRCIRCLGLAASRLVEKIRDVPWMKTCSGLRCPSESVFPDQESGDLLNVVPLPLIDEEFYGNGIKLFIPELKAIGVAVELKGVVKVLCNQLRSFLSSNSFTSAHVISLLKCIKCILETMPSQVLKLKTCLLGEKWLKTSQGYRSAIDTVLSDSKWGTVFQFVDDLPLIDEAFYGISINSYREELKILGVVVDFNEGAEFVAKGLKLPKEPKFVSAHTTLSLLQCARSLQSKLHNQSLDNFFRNLRRSKWLKTHVGYRSPNECILFDPVWECYLKPHDAPFIDEQYYQNLSSLDKEQLRNIGVKAGTDEVCTLIFRILMVHTQTCTIMRMYKFLNKFKWSPRFLDRSNSQLWIPDQCGTDGGGKWVNSKKLWNDWVMNKHEVTSAECSSFWRYMIEDWNRDTKKILLKNITMLPATTFSGKGIQLVLNEEVFIPDDLQLKKLFTEGSRKPLFVWSPQNSDSSLSQSRLYEIYTSLGVRKISESVQFDLSFTLSGGCKLEKEGPRNKLIGKSLIKIVLGFLAGPWIDMPVEERHEITKRLLDISVVDTDQQIMVTCSLQLPRRRVVIETTRLVFWDRTSSMLVIYKSSWEDRKNNIEFVSCFARAVAAVVLLHNRADEVENLSKIIQMAFAFGFEEDAVDFLLMTENLELSVKDKEFLQAAFPSGQSCSPVPLKCRSPRLESTSTSETPLRKRTRR